ncbi:circadian associated repressor of transcription a [Antennarius striatus]|uniref:circadian associated repressor of transcription a n=1 Tax=Antennarius striatus TaxID=241820 RepID=UPI0035B1C586
MSSLGSPSKWPSCDSLRSTPSFLHSESEQTEDEADASSEGEGDGGMAKFLRSKLEQLERRPDGGKRPDSASSPQDVILSSSSSTPGDLMFAQTCVKLQRFIPSLLGLLHGLKTGRFDKGLSSFQKSIAIDRFHRILGILQRPDMGEKYLHNLLQIEAMLKLWFPQVSRESTDAPSQTSTPRLAPRWRQNQLHMPVKKRKLSWSNHDPPSGNVSTRSKQQPHGLPGMPQAVAPLHVVTAGLPGSPKRQKTQEERGDDAARSGLTSGYESAAAPCSCHRRENENGTHPEIRAPSPGGPVAQDNHVSSSDSVSTDSSRC